MAELTRGTCRGCGRENCSINADGTVRHHQGTKPEHYAGPDSKKCKGVGQPPKESTDLPRTVTGFICRVPAGPEGCGRPVQLTSNGRARSHLNNAGHPCDGGSDWPLKVDPQGNVSDMKPVGEVRPAATELRYGSDDPVEDFLGTGAGPEPEAHRREADAAIAAAEADQRESDALYEQAVRDGMEESRRRVKAARDGRTPEQQAEIDRRMADPVGSALAGLMGAEVGDPGTVLNRLVDDHRAGMDRIADAAETRVFDETHRFADDTGTEWEHPGRVKDCRLPECCTHPDGFVYGDDGKGHSGEECPLCGSEPPHPEPDAWRTPADLLAKMPADVQALAAENPTCWDCGDEVIPLGDRFDLYGNPEVIVWGCQTNCENNQRRGEHYGRPCRPRAPYHARLGELTEGVLFRRHTAAPPMDQIVYRAGAPVMGPVSATVVTAGPYAGRTGSLTNLEEEITCTDLDGRPRPRRSTTTPPTSLPENGPQGRTNSPTPSGTGPGSKPSTRASAPDAGVKSTPVTGSGPTGKAPTSARTAVTPEEKEAGDLLAGVSGDHGEAKAEYGRWGRYKLRHPDTGKPVEWTRATTFAKSISDTFTLAQWGKRNVIVGATLRSDIVAMAHGKDVTKDRDQLNAWAEELEQAAGSKVSANLGTAVHSFTELIDRDWANRRTVLAEQIPEDFRPHCEAYILMLEESGLEPVPHMIEFSTGVLQYEVMGTSDNCYRATKHLVLKMPRGEVRLSPGEHVIGDKKTGKDLDYGWQEICIQLAVYAQGVNTLGMFDWGTKTWDKDPLSRFAEPGTKVREDVGVIVHIPVDPRSKKEPALYGVDLESGWSAAVLCERVRTWRKLRTLAGPVVVVDEDPADVPSGAPAAVQAPREPTIRERAETVTSRTEASAVYQAAVKAGLPVAEVKALIALMQERIAAVAEPGGAKV